MSSELTLEDAKVRWGYIAVPLATMCIATGAGLPVYSSGGSPGLGMNLVSSEIQSITWEADATPATAHCTVGLPPDLDDTEDLTFSFLVSKSGATVGDATTLTVGCFIIASGSLVNADANCGGATGAVTGDATAGTTATLTRVIAAADVPANAAALTFTVAPTAGTLGTDNFYCHAITIKYKRKAQTLAG
jgi:hypothetical protein